MKVLKTLWGLLVDDGRLAGILVAAIVVAAIVSKAMHSAGIAALFIWLGLIISLAISVEHQVKLKTKK